VFRRGRTALVVVGLEKVFSSSEGIPNANNSFGFTKPPSVVPAASHGCDDPIRGISFAMYARKTVTYDSAQDLLLLDSLCMIVKRGAGRKCPPPYTPRTIPRRPSTLSTDSSQDLPFRTRVRTSQRGALLDSRQLKQRPLGLQAAEYFVNKIVKGELH
jgi:hypothetical protein